MIYKLIFIVFVIDPVITIKPEEKPKEEKPTRVLDDLFRKTKTTPSIYWLPLSPEEVSILLLIYNATTDMVIFIFMSIQYICTCKHYK